METSPVTCRTLEEFYHINGRSFEKQYKETLSGYRSWNQLSHAQKWLLFEDNIGKNIAIDETSLSNGELYTIITNRDKHGKQGCLVAIVAGTKSLDVCKVLDKIDEKKREAVEEVTLDLSDSMRKIVRHCFPKAKRVIDRFHIQKLASDAVQQMRIEYRWAALQQANDEKENAKLEKIAYQPLTFENGDTRSELLVRSRYLLFKSSEKWTDEQKLRAKILFREYPDIKKAYGLSHSLRMIFAKNTIKDAARLSLAKWYNNVAEAGFHSFNVIAATFYEHYEDILNFYINRSTNAAAESFNAKIKLFRANLRGVIDKSFFLFRLAKIYAYPPLNIYCPLFIDKGITKQQYFEFLILNFSGFKNKDYYSLTIIFSFECIGKKENYKKSLIYRTYSILFIIGRYFFGIDSIMISLLR